ncbi:AGC/PKA protein kinase [Tremella mesenterica]|uniref:cAMP-dependent protein kinase n=1 Tax=Tremella mesenterica TaxID=5217 RepID=A0A4V1M465_TREME|nr:AGC/PKA protein kinase [Tremella mesenterica]
MFSKVSDRLHHRKQHPSTSSTSSNLASSSLNPGPDHASQSAQSFLSVPMEGVEPSLGGYQSDMPPHSEPAASNLNLSQAGTMASSRLPQLPASHTSAVIHSTAMTGSGTSSTPRIQHDDADGDLAPDATRQGSKDEDRIRVKAKEAQEQATQAQANLHHATQQARVAAINAAATQAALDTAVSQHSAASATSKPHTASVTGQPLRKTAGRYALADFQIERTLGTGSFGRVHLVRSKHNGRFYAVKVLNKDKVIKMKQVEHTTSEREMLVRVRHPFLVNLWGTFQDVNNLYMVMDFVAGGELFSLLRKSQRFPNSVAKFYAAEVALALDYLHSLDIIYRDLKPENLLLGADGHVKVTDFGFAKHVPDITWTLCGTPDYLAPEVVQSKGYNKSVDWYALGVLIFEMLAGYPPFFTEDGNPMKLYEKIIAGKVRYPSYFDALAKELLKNLLIGDLTKRFGNLRAGSSDIFAHPWFAEVDWDKLYRREIPAPYVPKIDGDGDASQFDRYQEADISEYGKVGTGPYDHFFTDF